MSGTATPDTVKETGCCPRFDPAPWDGQELHWQDRPFVKDRVRAFLHIPLNFGRVMTRNLARIEASGARSDGVVLCDDGLWGTDVYIGVDRDVPGTDLQRLSGTFLSRVFEGGYGQTGRWMREVAADAKARGVTPRKFWTYYTTCPKCAKAYGKNYVVILTQI